MQLSVPVIINAEHGIRNSSEKKIKLEEQIDLKRIPNGKNPNLKNNVFIKKIRPNGEKQRNNNKQTKRRKQISKIRE